MLERIKEGTKEGIKERIKEQIKEGTKEGRKEGTKEGYVLFNDALNTFYLRLYGVGHMVRFNE